MLTNIISFNPYNPMWYYISNLEVSSLKAQRTYIPRENPLVLL